MTANIRPIDVSQATGTTATALAGVKAKLGSVPNLFATLAHSPGALNFYLQGSEALGKGGFTAKQRELIALAVAESNACDYCLAAHTAIGGLVGLKPADIEAARGARAANPRDAALLTLTRRIVELRGNLLQSDHAAARDAGLSDADILEAVAVVALNIFTNYTNHVAGTFIDFPPAAALKAA